MLYIRNSVCKIWSPLSGSAAYSGRAPLAMKGGGGVTVPLHQNIVFCYPRPTTIYRWMCLVICLTRMEKLVLDMPLCL